MGPRHCDKFYYLRPVGSILAKFWELLNISHPQFLKDLAWQVQNWLHNELFFYALSQVGMLSQSQMVVENF